MARDYIEHNEALEQRRTERITQHLKELDQMRPAYLEAKETIQGRTDYDDVLDMAQLLKSYKAGEPGEKAIFVVAQAALLVNKMVMPFAIVRNYEAKENEVEKLRK